VTDRQRRRQMDRHIDSKCHTSLHCAAYKTNTKSVEQKKPINSLSICEVILMSCLGILLWDGFVGTVIFIPSLADSQEGI